MNEIVKLLGTGVLGGVIGGFVGAYSQHKFARSRDREAGIFARKRKFSAFMAQLKSETADLHHPPGTFADFYTKKIPNLRHAAKEIEDDFSGERRTEFERLVSKAAGYNGAQADNGKSKILEDFNAIIRFLEN